MSLRYALLVTLLDGDASGYELAKRFDIRVAAYWHAQPPQLYAELGKLEADGLVGAETVVQDRRPNKRMFSITEAGQAALREWLETPPRPLATKDDLLVRMAAVEEMDPLVAIDHLRRRRDHALSRLATYREIEQLVLRGRAEVDYLRTARHIGSYLTLHKGIGYELERADWCDWAIQAIRQRHGWTVDPTTEPKRTAAAATDAVT